jgi:hypothetical protein
MTKEAYLSKIYSNEGQFQAATFQYINNNYKDLRGFFFHPPNENQHRLISMGILPGIPDLVFIKPKLWAIELKHGKGTLSPAQKNLHKLWGDYGIKIFTCHTPQQVLNALDEIFQF